MMKKESKKEMESNKMKNIILKILVNILKIVYIPMKLLKVKNKITYISRQSNYETLDFKQIREEMEKQYPEYKNIVLTKKIEGGIISKIQYCINIFNQMYHLATSKIVILDTYCITACILEHKKETKVIQIWHALGAVKKFGYQTINAKSGSDEKTAKTMCMHKNYDYVLAPSKETGKIYQKAFNIELSNIQYIGMPRVDYILTEDEKTKNTIYEKYPNLRHKINILYVPTFRKGEKVELDELVEKIDTERYNLIIKLHPLDLKDYKYKEKDGVIYDRKFKTYDWIKLVDKVITDYSSLAMEAALLDLPLYFYTYDIDKYEQDTGLNLEFEKENIGKYQTKNVEELINLIDEQYDYTILNEFKEKYIDVETKDCTKQIIEFMMRLMKNEEIENMGNEPSKEKHVV